MSCVEPRVRRLACPGVCGLARGACPRGLERPGPGPEVPWNERCDPPRRAGEAELPYVKEIQTTI